MADHSMNLFFWDLTRFSLGGWAEIVWVQDTQTGHLVESPKREKRFVVLKGDEGRMEHPLNLARKIL